MRLESTVLTLLICVTVLPFLSSGYPRRENVRRLPAAGTGGGPRGELKLHLCGAKLECLKMKLKLREIEITHGQKRVKSKPKHGHNWKKFDKSHRIRRATESYRITPGDFGYGYGHGVKSKSELKVDASNIIFEDETVDPSLRPSIGINEYQTQTEMKRDQRQEVIGSQVRQRNMKTAYKGRHRQERTIDAIYYDGGIFSLQDEFYDYDYDYDFMADAADRQTMEEYYDEEIDKQEQAIVRSGFYDSENTRWNGEEDLEAEYDKSETKDSEGPRMMDTAKSKTPQQANKPGKGKDKVKASTKKGKGSKGKKSEESGMDADTKSATRGSHKSKASKNAKGSHRTKQQDDHSNNKESDEKDSHGTKNSKKKGHDKGSDEKDSSGTKNSKKKGHDKGSDEKDSSGTKNSKKKGHDKGSDEKDSHGTKNSKKKGHNKGSDEVQESKKSKTDKKKPHKTNHSKKTSPSEDSDGAESSKETKSTKKKTKHSKKKSHSKDSEDVKDSEESKTTKTKTKHSKKKSHSKDSEDVQDSEETKTKKKTPSAMKHSKKTSHSKKKHKPKTDDSEDNESNEENETKDSGSKEKSKGHHGKKSSKDGSENRKTHKGKTGSTAKTFKHKEKSTKGTSDETEEEESDESEEEDDEDEEDEEDEDSSAEILEAIQEKNDQQTGQIDHLLSKLNTLIGDIEESESKTDKGIITMTKINNKGNGTGGCSAFTHSVVASGYKGYVNYLSSRVASTLPYIIDGEETFMLHHLDRSMKNNNVQLSVELTSKSCHCIRGVDVKPILVGGKRHAMMTKFTVEYYDDGWNYIHSQDGKMRLFSIAAQPSHDSVVPFHGRVYTTALRIFPQDWMRLPWVRVQPIDCG